jgi:hypothetical protein
LHDGPLSPQCCQPQPRWPCRHLAPQVKIDPALIERFGRMMREHFTTGSVPFRKAYLQSLITAIEVDDTQIRIKGSKDLLEKAVLAGQNGPAACSQMSTSWRARRDSNYRCCHFPIVGGGSAEGQTAPLRFCGKSSFSFQRCINITQLSRCVRMLT